MVQKLLSSQSKDIYMDFFFTTKLCCLVIPCACYNNNNNNNNNNNYYYYYYNINNLIILHLFCTHVHYLLEALHKKLTKLIVT